MRDLDELFSALTKSRFRARFALKPKELAYCLSKGRSTIRDHAADFIARRLAPAEIANDGKQTPYRGHPVFIAQHATATCCRSCLEKWHQIPKGTTLSPDEQAQAVAAIMRWIDTQVDKSES